MSSAIDQGADQEPYEEEPGGPASPARRALEDLMPSTAGEPDQATVLERLVTSYVDQAVNLVEGRVINAVREAMVTQPDLTKPFVMGVAVGIGTFVIALLALAAIGFLFLHGVSVFRAG